MLDDVAAYLVMSPVAAVVVLLAALAVWGVRRLSPELARREQKRNSRGVAE